MSTDARTNEILSDEMLERFADRAPIYDEKNTFLRKTSRSCATRGS